MPFHAFPCLQKGGLPLHAGAAGISTHHRLVPAFPAHGWCRLGEENRLWRKEQAYMSGTGWFLEQTGRGGWAGSQFVSSQPS